MNFSITREFKLAVNCKQQVLDHQDLKTRFTLFMLIIKVYTQRTRPEVYKVQVYESSRLSGSLCASRQMARLTLAERKNKSWRRGELQEEAGGRDRKEGRRRQEKEDSYMSWKRRVTRNEAERSYVTWSKRDKRDKR